MSSMPQTEFQAEDIRVSLERSLNQPVSSLERIGGGRNSQVFQVELGKGERVALKIYFRHAEDKRDRLANEYHAFSYLWANGIHQVPKPLASEPALGWAVYQFIEGDKLA